MSKTKLALTVVALLVLGVSTAIWFSRPRESVETMTMKKLAGNYLSAVYSQDYEKAYAFISKRDRRAKDQATYMRENPSFPATTRALVAELARLIHIGRVTANIGGDRATLQFPVRLPDANSRVLQELFHEFDPDRIAALTPADRRKIIKVAQTMSQEGRLPTIAGNETMDLIKENGEWRIFVNWSDAVKVTFRAEVREGLPWAFEPVQNVVLAKPGETLHAAYRVRNLTDTPLTAKARHIDQPKELAAKYLEVIQCFCFIRETLAPGEEKELPLLFRVDLDVPRDIKEFVVTYQFFPLEKFPKDPKDGQASEG